jgi:hypothetical protein
MADGRRSDWIDVGILGMGRILVERWRDSSEGVLYGQRMLRHYNVLATSCTNFKETFALHFILKSYPGKLLNSRGGK